MLSVCDFGLGNMIQEDLQANMSKMLDMTLRAFSVWGWFAAKRDSCWWLLCKSCQQKLNRKPWYVKWEAMPNYSIYRMFRKTINIVLWYPPFIFR